MINENTVRDFLQNFDDAKHHKMLSVFSLSLNSHIDTCRAALKSQNAEALKASIHDIKSLSYTIGDEETGQMAERIEKAVIDGDFSQAFEDTPALLGYVEAAVEIIERMAGDLEAP